MITDSEEEIKQCLSCRRASCTNCLGWRRDGPKKKAGRKPQPVARTKGSVTEQFHSASEAAEAMGCSAFKIRSAARESKLLGGYKWSYA